MTIILEDTRIRDSTVLKIQDANWPEFHPSLSGRLLPRESPVKAPLSPVGGGGGLI